MPQQAFPTRGARQQVPPQVSVVHAAWQVPAEQDCPVAQALVQEPQWAGSVWRSTQVVPHRVKPAAQVCWHAPDEQIWPAAQAFVQEPQCFGSLATSVQTVVDPSAQISRGGLQTQADCVQTSPAMQTFPQAPQLEALTAVSTQVPVVGLAGQSATVEGEVSHSHAPAAHVPSPQE